MEAFIVLVLWFAGFLTLMELLLPTSRVYPGAPGEVWSILKRFTTNRLVALRELVFCNRLSPYLLVTMYEIWLCIKTEHLDMDFVQDRVYTGLMLAFAVTLVRYVERILRQNAE